MRTQPIVQKKKYEWDETVRTLLFAIVLAVIFRSVAFEPFHIPSGSMKSTLLVGDYLFVSKYSYGYSRYSFPLGLAPFSGRILEFHKPERGDIVVFRPPGTPYVDYIKRIIGMPGDHIQVQRGIVYINGTPLKRTFIDDFIDKQYNEDAETLPDNNYRYDDPAAHEKKIPEFSETLPDGKVITILKEIAAGAEDMRDADNTPIYTVPEGHYFMMGDNRDNSRDSRYAFPVGYVPEENLVGRAEIIFFSVDGSFEWGNLATWIPAMRLGRFFKVIH